MKARCLYYDGYDLRTTNVIGIGRNYTDLELVTVTERNDRYYLFHLRRTPFDFILLEHGELRIIELVAAVVNVVESSNNPYKGNKPIVCIVEENTRGREQNEHLIRMLSRTHGICGVRFVAGRRIGKALDLMLG